MDKLYYIASLIVFSTLTLTEGHGENLGVPNQDQTAIPSENTSKDGELPIIIDRIKLFSGELVTQNVNHLLSKEEKNSTDHISVDNKENTDLAQQTLEEEHSVSESSDAKGLFGVHGNIEIPPSVANHGDNSRVPRQSPSNSAAFQERLQQQIRDNPEQAQKIKEMQADAQARYQQALDTERAKMFGDPEQMQKVKEKLKEGGMKNKEGGMKNKEGGMKKLKQRKGKGGKGKERKKGSKKGSGEGKRKRGERKNKQKSSKKGRKGDRERKRKNDKGATGFGFRDRIRSHVDTKGQAPSYELM